MLARALKLSISLCLHAFDRAASVAWALAGRTPEMRCIALCYHSVPRDQSRRFERQLDEIVRLGNPVPAGAEEYRGTGAPGIIVTFDDGFSDTLKTAGPPLAARGIPYAVFVPAGCLGKHASWPSESASGSRRERVLDEGELRSLAGDPLVTVGSHGWDHGNLALLPAEGAREELVRSRRFLETATGKEITLFSFPYGAYLRETHPAWAAEAGYRRSFTSDPVPALAAPGERLTGRFDVSTEDWPIEFRLKLAGAYRWLPAAFALKRKILGCLRGGEKGP